jgi:ABC-type glutathione transport system ATPase component
MSEGLSGPVTPPLSIALRVFVFFTGWLEPPRALLVSSTFPENVARPEFDMAPAAQAHHADVMARINQALTRDTGLETST